MQAIIPTIGTWLCLVTRITRGPHHHKRLLDVVESTSRRLATCPWQHA